MTRKALLDRARRASESSERVDDGTLAEVFRREVDGMGRRYIEQMAVHGEPLLSRAAKEALRGGVSPDVVRETLEECRALHNVPDFPRTTEQMVADIELLVSEVIADMPKASLEQRMAEAMKRNKGSMNPRLVQNALRILGRGC